MFGLMTILVMALVTYAFWREGVLTACSMCVNVVLAGLVTISVYEPIADELDTMVRNSFLEGYEDFLALIGAFSLSLGLLRLLTNSLAVTDTEVPPLLHRVGGVFFGLLTGYLVAGFLVCAIQTLPVPQNFLGFESKVERGAEGFRRLFPGDRVFLAMMHRAGGEGPLGWEGHPTFDPNGNFGLRYARYRRYPESSTTGKPMPDDGAASTR